MHVGSSTGHGVRPSIPSVWHHMGRGHVTRGGCHGRRAAGRRGGTEDIGEGGISLGMVVIRWGAIAALVILIIGHNVVFPTEAERAMVSVLAFELSKLDCSVHAI